MTGDKTASGTIGVGLFLDNTTTTNSAIDLMFQKTGSHILKIIAQDEAGNASSTEARFSIMATIDSIMANVNQYASMSLINKTEKAVLNVQLQLLKSQFNLLEQTKNNTRLSAKARIAAISILKSIINLQIYLIVKEVKKATGKTINVKIANLIFDSLQYVRID